MELSLKGKNGKKTIEADALGRVVRSEITVPAVPGDKVFLTIDSEFQKDCEQIVRNTLRDAIASKVGSSYSIKELCISMVNINKKIVHAAYSSEEDKPELFRIKQTFINNVAEFDISKPEKIKEAKDIVSQNIEDNNISPQTIVLALFEMGMLNGDDEYIANIKSGKITPTSVIREKLMSDELEPSDTGADPCSAGLAVLDVKTGAALALVTYPSYDNNELVNSFNIDYYDELRNDENFPLINRPLMTRKAPGSTFKMVTATAALEEGIITPTSLLTDYGTFTKAGKPHARCWIQQQGGSHGSINVSKAIEVSCNYFFYECAWGMGNQTVGTTIQGITTLGRYMSHFGLTGQTGLEIEETIPRAASPEYKAQVMKETDPDATPLQLQWTDGDTIRTAIGQSLNSFTPAAMAKYVAILANGGTRYKLHLIDKHGDFFGNGINEAEPVVESELNIKPENLEAIYKGMIAVTAGASGTSRSVFQSLPMLVAGKTGTAQEDLKRSSHTWFVGFAPYETPEISVAVMIPFGESVPSPSAVVARDVIDAYYDLSHVSTSKENESAYDSFISK